MADERTFIKLHDGMPDHPKVDGLSDAAFRLLITMWCWCSRHTTDGHVPAATWAKRGTANARRELIDAGLVVTTGVGVEMRDYLKHQRSAARVAEVRAARSAASALANHKRWHKTEYKPDCAHCVVGPKTDPTTDPKSDPKSDRPGMPTGVPFASRFGNGERSSDVLLTPGVGTGQGSLGDRDVAPTSPDADHGDPKSDPKTDPKRLPNFSKEDRRQKTEELIPSESVPRASARAGFAKFWAVYPLRKEPRAAERAWDKATKTAAPEDIIAGAERYRDDPTRKPNYTKHPATWLNGGCWMDEPTQPALVGATNGHAVNGRHQPYRDAVDTADFYGEL